VIVNADNLVVAYACLSMTGIDISAARTALAMRSPDPVPALLLGRLAVGRRHGGLGIGTALVSHVLATALELNAAATCKVVVVVALDERARSWWKRLGFHPFDPLDASCLDLYLLTGEIAKTLGRA